MSRGQVLHAVVTVGFSLSVRSQHWTFSGLWQVLLCSLPRGSHSEVTGLYNSLLISKYTSHVSRFLSLLHVKSNTPVTAQIFNAIITVVMICVTTK